MNVWKKIWKSAVVCLTAAAVISGCSVAETLSPAPKGEKEYVAGVIKNGRVVWQK